jgi:hypothetical protein
MGGDGRRDGELTVMDFGGNSHSAPAGAGWWWCDPTIANEILVPGSNPKNPFFFLADDGQKLVDK